MRSEDGSPGVREGNRVMVWECARPLEELRLTDHGAPRRTAVSGDLEGTVGEGPEEPRLRPNAVLTC